MGKVLCMACQNGTLNWKNPKPEDDDLPFDDFCARTLICNNCGKEYEGYAGVNKFNEERIRHPKLQKLYDYFDSFDGSEEFYVGDIKELIQKVDGGVDI